MELVIKKLIHKYNILRASAKKIKKKNLIQNDIYYVVIKYDTQYTIYDIVVDINDMHKNANRIYIKDNTYYISINDIDINFSKSKKILFMSYDDAYICMSVCNLEDYATLLLAKNIL